jgi:site-specific DNA-methyltransferase (adenine-specific)
MPDASVDSVVTDPPYGLGKEPKARDVLRAWLDGEEFKPGGAGFMGKAWDAFVPSPLVWAECLRVLKPGGHLVAFAGSRTYDWIALGVRLAGFEVRDQLFYMYGSGFPKSMNVSKALDRAAGADREVVGVGFSWNRPDSKDGHTARMNASPGAYDITAPATDAARTWEGWGTALKPSFEPIVWARKPLNVVPDHSPIVLARKPLSGTVAANVLEHGTGAINVDGCRIGTSDGLNGGSYSEGGNPTPLPGDQRTVAGAGMFAEGGGRLPGQFVQPSGRWPANILHDGSPEVLAVFPETGSATNHVRGDGSSMGFGGGRGSLSISNGHNDTGSAARFYYCAKASRAERELGLADFAPETVGDGRQAANDTAYQRGKTERRNTHPTCKPVAVMRWLVRLITPPGGTVVDPFTGSGTTGVAAALEGFDFIGCELSPEYVEIARARIAHARKFPAMWEPGYVAPDEVPDEQLDLFGS